MDINYKIYQSPTGDFFIELGNKCYFVFSNELHFVDCVNLHYKSKIADDKILKLIDKGSYILKTSVKNSRELLNETLKISYKKYKQLPTSTKIKIRKAVVL